MWTRVRVEVQDTADAEAIAGELWALGAAGCEVRDGDTFSELDDSTFDRRVDGGAHVIAFFDPERDPPPLRSVLNRYSRAQVTSVRPFDDRFWRNSWRQYFRPERLSARVAVRPSWETTLPSGTHSVVLVIDPGLAFGTGTHETTRLCVQAIDEHLAQAPEASVLDVGCGSGILTMAAHQLGAATVLGIDIDPIAVAVARDNWVLNNLGTAAQAPFAATPLTQVEGAWDLIVANILAGTLLGIRAKLLARLASGGTLVLSGLLAAELDEFVDAFFGLPRTPPRTRQLGDWASVSHKSGLL